MIKKICIRNFQSHENSEIIFHPNFNAIIGPTNSGKSSIVRALNFLFFNEPWNQSFMRNNKKVIIDAVINETKLRRIKSDKDNYISLISEKNKIPECEFNNFGYKMPMEIVDFTKLYFIELDEGQKINMNIVNQFERIFLLNDSGAIRAKFIHKLSGIHIIDNILRDTNKDIKELNMNIKNKNEQLNKLKKDLELLYYVNIKKKKMEDINNKIKILKENIDKINKLEDLYDKILKWRQDKEKIVEQIEKLNKINFYLIDKLEDYEVKINRLKEIKENYIELIKKYKKIDEKKQKFENIDFKLINILENYKNEMDVLEKLNIEIENFEKNLQNVYIHYNNILREFSNNKEKYKIELKKKKNCPICNSLLNNEKIEEIIKAI